MPTFSKRTIAATWHARRVCVKRAAESLSCVDPRPRPIQLRRFKGASVKGRSGAMIISCGNCAKRYVVDPRALGTPGRRVRCANCQHTWFQAAPEETLSSIELPPLPETPPVVRTTAPEAGAARRVQLPGVK